MTQTEKKSGNSPDFEEIRKRYEKLSRGDQAQIGKRIGSPEDLALVPAFYKLFPGISPSEWHYRAAFLVPFIRNSSSAPTMGRFIAEQERLKNTGNLERRVLQVARARPHQDVVYMRRLLMRFDEPTINWMESGLAQFFSVDKEKNTNGKKKFIEQYFIARHAEKGN
jgi:CRISPR system Cascade subunit CasB